MSKVFICSDPHFGHHNMARSRGFKDSEQHDNFLVEKWNLVITPKDKVFILGDITMEKNNYEILSKLNGRIVVVLGNHDKPNHVKELLKYVDSVAGVINYKGHILSHIPIHPSELRRFGKNIHGHLHEKSLKDPRYICVSYERLKHYQPIEFNVLLENNKKLTLKQKFYKLCTKLNFLIP